MQQELPQLGVGRHGRILPGCQAQSRRVDGSVRAEEEEFRHPRPRWDSRKDLLAVCGVAVEHLAGSVECRAPRPRGLCAGWMAARRPRRDFIYSQQRDFKNVKKSVNP